MSLHGQPRKTWRGFVVDPIIVAVDQLHCLNCQPPGVVVECPTEADKQAFIEQHKDCTWPPTVDEGGSKQVD